MTITAALGPIPLIGLHRSPQLIGAVMRLCVLEQGQLLSKDDLQLVSIIRQQHLSADPCRSIPWHLYRPIGGLPR